MKQKIMNYKYCFFGLLCILFSYIAHAEPPDWEFDQYQYSQSMTLTCELRIKGVLTIDENDIVGAFVNDECRGLSSPIYIESMGKALIFLNVLSNVSSGETIYFKVYDASADTIFEIDETQEFLVDKSIGSISAPHLWVIPNDVADFEAFSFPQQTSTASINTTMNSIDIEVKSDADITNLQAVFSVSYGATAKIGTVIQHSGETANDFTEPLVYTIIAEDSITSKDWTINVTKEYIPNTETNFTSFFLPEQTGEALIDNQNHTIEIEVAAGTDVSALQPEFSLSFGATAAIGSIVQISGVSTVDFSHPVVYKITAENPDYSQEWTVTVTIEYVPNTGTDFTAFVLPQQTGEATINTNEHTIHIEVSSDTDLSSLTPFFTLSYGATASIGSIIQQSGQNTIDFTNSVIYTVIAENPNISQSWIVTVTEEYIPNTETDFIAFSFLQQTGEAVINPQNHTISIEVSNGTDLSNMIADFSLSYGATAAIGTVEQTSGETVNDFTQPVIYTVTAENTEFSQNWTVTVTEEYIPNTETDFIAFSFSQQTGEALINAENHTISIEVSNGTDLSNIVADFSLSYGATAAIGTVEQTSGETVNDFTQPVIYTVTAENTEFSQNWTVTVTEEYIPNTETDFIAFSFSQQTGEALINAENHTISIEVSNGTDLSNMIADFSLSYGATAAIGTVEQTSGETVNDFTQPVIYTVTAENAEFSQDWTVIVTEEYIPNTETDFIAFSFSQQTGEALINAENHTISIEVSNGTDLSNMIADFSVSYGATVTIGTVIQISDTSINDFSNEITYSVIAEDNQTVQDWTISVTEKTPDAIRQNTLPDISVYPNPFVSEIILQTGNLFVEHIDIYSISGEHIKTIIVNHKKQTIYLNASHFAEQNSKGIYILRIKTMYKLFNIKVIKQ